VRFRLTRIAANRLERTGWSTLGDKEGPILLEVRSPGPTHSRCFYRASLRIFAANSHYANVHPGSAGINKPFDRIPKSFADEAPELFLRLLGFVPAGIRPDIQPLRPETAPSMVLPDYVAVVRIGRGNPIIFHAEFQPTITVTCRETWPGTAEAWPGSTRCR